MIWHNQFKLFCCCILWHCKQYLLALLNQNGKFFLLMFEHLKLNDVTKATKIKHLDRRLIDSTLISFAYLTWHCHRLNKNSNKTKVSTEMFCWFGNFWMFWQLQRQYKKKVAFLPREEQGKHSRNWNLSLSDTYNL